MIGMNFIISMRLKSLQSKNDKQFFKICSEFVSYLKDGHLSFSYSQQTKSKVREDEGYAGGFQSAFDARIIEDRPIVVTFEGNIDSIVGEFGKAVEKFKKARVKGVVIDVRYSTGGNESFRDILGYLTDKKIYINNYRFKKSGRFNDIYFLRPFLENIRSGSSHFKQENGYTKWWSWRVTPNKEQYLTTIPVAVLCNEGIFSSTSSFVNACLESDLATVLGNIIPLSGCGLSTPFYTPSRKYILSYGFIDDRDINLAYHENITKDPDIKVSQTLEDYYQGIDTQLSRAIEYINNKK